jgi:hypothetical protein
MKSLIEYTELKLSLRELNKSSLKIFEHKNIGTRNCIIQRIKN